MTRTSVTRTSPATSPARRLAAVVVAAALTVACAASAQEMTERYIPVGAYPSLTGERTAVGTIGAVDVQARRLELRGDAGARTLQLTDATWIWLDRSRLGQPNTDGTVSDLRAGLKAEVRTLAPERPDTARWVKVQIVPGD